MGRQARLPASFSPPSVMTFPDCASLTGFSESGEPLILGHSGTVYRALSAKLRAVPDSELDSETRQFVDEWRSRHLDGVSGRIKAERDAKPPRQR